MSEEQSNRQDSNIPLLRTLKKRGKRASATLSFRPTRSMSTSKSLRKPKVANNLQVEAVETNNEAQKES